MDKDRETTSRLEPKFDASGLIATVVTDARAGGVLMVGFMNAEALEKTINTDRVHFFSRSRNKLWMKGETSGNTLEVEEIRIDCDQDALWIAAHPQGPTCHTGEQSCFYRVVKGQKLERLS